jgi:poly(A)-specific ribonuclease
MPLRTRDYMRMQAERSGAEPRGAEPLRLTPEDQRFVSELHATVSAWLGATEEPQLVLPAVNSFLRMLQYRELAKPQFGNPQHPGFYVTRLEGGGSSPNLVLVRATAQEAAQHEQEQRAARVAEVQRAAGFSRVMELVAQCGKPAVGHNPLFDVSYVLAQFVDQQLPLSWQDFRALAARWGRRGGVWCGGVGGAGLLLGGAAA